MLHVLKRLGTFLAIGGVLGDVATMLFAPSFLTWFHTPGTGSALCNCADVSRETASALVNAQLVGTAGGALALTVVGELVVRLWDSRKKKGGSPPSLPSSGSGTPVPSSDVPVNATAP